MMYPVFTASSGTVTVGARVERFELSGGTAIAAIVIGEAGRGRKLGVLPVAGEAPAPGQPYTIVAAEIAQTRAGKPKLLPGGSITDTTSAIVVLRTKIGFRGGNSHTGDRSGTKEDGTPVGFLPFPGQILSDGAIAQGIAGYAGGGSQYIVLMPRGVVFRTSYSGRLYGGPSSHYYVFDGATIRAATWDERMLLDEDPMKID